MKSETLICGKELLVILDKVEQISFKELEEKFKIKEEELRELLRYLVKKEYIVWRMPLFVNGDVISPDEIKLAYKGMEVVLGKKDYFSDLDNTPKTVHNKAINSLSKKEASLKARVLKVFVSYSSEDLEKITSILDQLKVINEIGLFFAKDSIKPGDNISQEIINGIQECDFFLLFYSRAAVQSPYVQQEIGIAKSKNKRIIPILLDGTKPLGMISSDVNYLDLSNQAESQAKVKKLISFIIESVQKKKLNQTLALGILGAAALFMTEEK